VTVSDLVATRDRIEADALEAAERALGIAGAGAFGIPAGEAVVDAA
jgi:hypothetical protein